MPLHSRRAAIWRLDGSYVVNPNKLFEQPVKWLVIWVAMALMRCDCNAGKGRTNGTNCHYEVLANKPRFLMMTSSNGKIFRVTGPLCGEFTGPGEVPTQRPVTQSFDVSLICVWIDGWVNNRDLRRPRGRYDVNVMWTTWPPTSSLDRVAQMNLRVMAIIVPYLSLNSGKDT